LKGLKDNILYHLGKTYSHIKMVYNEKIKNSIMKWRNTHREQYNTYLRDVSYVRNGDKLRKKRMGRYYMEQELKVFRQILI
jgi:uncharacterized phage-like protein YoqJ